MADRPSAAPTPVVTCLSSMATKHLLAAAAQAWRAAGGHAVDVESVGGVVALKRVMDGEAVDLVVLADDAIATLAAAGRLREASRMAIADAHLAMALRAGAPRPDIHDEASLRTALLSARSIGLSTGPSGTALKTLFAQWNLADRLGDRLVQAPPGVGVGTLVARGEVELGFQQLSELVHLEGIDIVRELPPALDIVTTFTGAVTAASTRGSDAGAFLSWLCSPANDPLRQAHGLQRAAAI